MDFQNIQQTYITEQQKVQDIANKVTKHEEQIARLIKRKHKQQDKSHWTDLLIRPVLAEVKLKFPQINWEDYQLTPLGLRSAVTVFGYIGEKVQFDYSNLAASITFTIGDLRKGELYIDTGEKKSDYPQNSIGDLNGFGNITIQVTNIQDVFNHVETRLEEYNNKKETV